MNSLYLQNVEAVTKVTNLIIFLKDLYKNILKYNNENPNQRKITITCLKGINKNFIEQLKKESQNINDVLYFANFSNFLYNNIGHSQLTITKEIQFLSNQDYKLLKRFSKELKYCNDKDFTDLSENLDFWIDLYKYKYKYYYISGILILFLLIGGIVYYLFFQKNEEIDNEENLEEIN